MKIVFVKRSKKFFVVSLCPVEKSESIMISVIKEKIKGGDNISYDGFTEMIGLKTIYFRFNKITFHFIGSSQKDKEKIDLLIKILKGSKKIIIPKKSGEKKESIRICISF